MPLVVRFYCSVAKRLASKVILPHFIMNNTMTHAISIQGRLMFYFRCFWCALNTYAKRTSHCSSDILALTSIFVHHLCLRWTKCRSKYIKFIGILEFVFDERQFRWTNLINKLNVLNSLWLSWGMIQHISLFFSSPFQFAHNADEYWWLMSEFVRSE